MKMFFYNVRGGKMIKHKSEIYKFIYNIKNIMQDRNYDKNKSKIIKIFFIIIIIILICFGGYSIAKDVERINIKSESDIAKPILIIEKSPSMDVTAMSNYVCYKFSIKNYNEKDMINELKLKYYIQFSKFVNDYIDIELYQGTDKINLDNNKTEYFELAYNQKEERDYIVKVKFNKEKVYSANDIVGKIKIKVHTEQISA